MIHTLGIYFSLEIAYRLNSIIYHLHRIPVIKRLFSGHSYDARGFKLVLNVLAVMKELIWGLVTKGAYLIIVLSMVGIGIGNEILPESISTQDTYCHILILWTVIGALINNQLFECSENSYYAVTLLRMNAKHYALTNYVYTMIKHVAGLLFFGLILSALVSLPVQAIVIFPFYVVGVKVFEQALELFFYDYFKKNNKVKIGIQVSCLIVILAFSLGLPCIGVVIPLKVSYIIMIAGILLGLISGWKIIVFNRYEIVYKRELFEYKHGQDNVAVSNETVIARGAISDDSVSCTSDKEGFAYMNDLFVKRHRKILWGSAVKMSLFIAGLFIFAIGLIIIDSEVSDNLNEMIMMVVPYLVFVMYMINRGTGYTQALFVNCDHSLLTYSFYKERKAILRLFRIRLFDIVKVNLLPALIIGVGLDIVLLVSGGTDSVINYAILFLAAVSLSVFFSVHYLALYYLLQPFDADTNVKNPLYSVIKWVTYGVSYSVIQLEIENLGFVIGTIVFCVLYSVIACVLVYMFAPKTFRIRNA